VPVEQLGEEKPVRHAAAEVELGQPYAVALTSPAGVWSCLVGCTVCFERRDPPLLRVLETRVTQEQPLPVAPAVSAGPPFPPPLPPRKAGPPATPRERSGRTLLSARADRE